MRKRLLGHRATCLFAIGASAAHAQGVTELDFDYDAVIECLPIESEVYGPATTFTNQSGGVTNFYGQLNLTYQGFDDGEHTTSGIVDNGNWNTRLGFTVTQPLENSALRFRFETGLDYYSGRDFVSDGAQTENYGLYAVQSFDSASLDLYAGCGRFTYSDRLGGSYHDADGLLVGARLFF